MLTWLLSPIDPDRVHEVGLALSWHGRFMVLAWGVLAPLAVLIARFFKVMPGQDWPRELDVQVWWKTHWMGQGAVFVVTLVGLGLVMPSGRGPLGLHGLLGYGVVVGVVLQVALGLLRGTKGGPTAPAPDGSLRGDHYDMSPRRRRFEGLHKTIGYGVLVLAAVTILLGMWTANAPGWMWLVMGVWWSLLICAFIVLQRRGWAVDTYQAIWGDDPSHPGNRMAAPGWGVRRLGANKGDSDVRHDRRDRVRGH